MAKSKRKKRKKSPKIFRSKSLKLSTFSAFIALILYFFGWVGIESHKVVLPDPGFPPVFYSNQANDDLRSTFVSAIKGANESILLYIYSLTDPQIIAALKEKAEQGVEVKVIHDPDTAQWGFNKLGQKIERVEKNGPGLMHRKILVVDKEKVWIGSANFTSDSLKLHDNLVIGFVSKHLAERITNGSCYIADTLLAQPPPEFEIGGQRIEFWRLPEDKELAFKRVLELINGAQNSLKVAMFTWTHPQITEAVINAHKRGVKVEIAIDHQSGLGPSALTVEKLSQAGLNIGLSSGTGLLHHKFAYIDGKTLINGSTNWTKAAFSKNEDCFLVLHNLNEEQVKKMDQIWHVISCQKERL